MLNLCLLATLLCRAEIDNNTVGVRAQFDRANRLYDQQKYTKAREIYEEIVRTGMRDPVVLYNLGNSCARMGDGGASVLYYSRALRLAPRDSDIRENLSRLEPPINKSKTFFLLKPLAWVENHMSLDEWTLLCSLFFIFGFTASGFRLLFRTEKIKHLFRTLIILSGIFLLLSGCFLSLKIYEELVVQTAIVMKPDTLAHSGPGSQFEELYKLPAGTSVRIISKPRKGWVRIRLKDGRSAYLPLTSIRNLNT